MVTKQQREHALSIIGGLTQTSKMPCKSWSIPAMHCKVGTKLAQKAGTICSGCYALKFRYLWRNTQRHLQNRLDLFNRALEEGVIDNWIDSLTLLLKGERFFRFFDSGDLQSVEMLDALCRVARKSPKTKFWLPTKEADILSSYLKKNQLPKNLIVRLSAYKWNEFPNENLIKKLGVRGSGAVEKSRIKEFDKAGHVCKAYKQNNTCQDCRYCWNGKKTVFYLKH